MLCLFDVLEAIRRISELKRAVGSLANNRVEDGGFGVTIALVVCSARNAEIAMEIVVVTLISSVACDSLANYFLQLELNSMIVDGGWWMLGGTTVIHF